MLLRKTAENTAVILLELGDLIICGLSFILAYYLRFHVQIFPLTKDFQSLSDYILPIAAISVIWVLVNALRRVYVLDISLSSMRDMERILTSSVLATIVIMMLSFLYRGYAASRLMLIIGAFIAFVLTFIFHRLVVHSLRKMIKKGLIHSRKLFIGTDEHTLSLINKMKKEPLLEHGITGCLSLDNSEIKVEKSMVLGHFEDLRDFLINMRIDEVIFSQPISDEIIIQRAIYECRKEKVLFQLVPNFHEMLRGNISVDMVGNIGMLSFQDVARTRFEKVLKRTFDIIFSSILIILTFPLFFITAIAIKLDSKGQLFFCQDRVGRNGRIFKMIKFRSMRQGADNELDNLIEKNEIEGAMFKIKRDPRITKVGHFIRKYSIDEFPQIYNVFIGDMSLIGPRPVLQREVDMYEKWQLKRIDTYPGMTGLWQVSGRSDLTFEKMVELDLYYIENWSLWLDIKILFLTIPAVLSGKGAY